MGKEEEKETENLSHLIVYISKKEKKCLRVLILIMAMAIDVGKLCELEK